MGSIATDIDRKLCITAAGIGALTRKDPAAAFRRVNPRTSFDLERAHKWPQGRARPRDQGLYDDWALVLDIGRPGGWIADCALEDLVALLCARKTLDSETLLRRAQVFAGSVASLGIGAPSDAGTDLPGKFDGARARSATLGVAARPGASSGAASRPRRARSLPWPRRVGGRRPRQPRRRARRSRGRGPAACRLPRRRLRLSIRARAGRRLPCVGGVLRSRVDRPNLRGGLNPVSPARTACRLGGGFVPAAPDVRKHRVGQRLQPAALAIAGVPGEQASADPGEETRAGLGAADGAAEGLKVGAHRRSPLQREGPRRRRAVRAPTIERVGTTGAGTRWTPMEFRGSGWKRRRRVPAVEPRSRLVRALRRRDPTGRVGLKGWPGAAIFAQGKRPVAGLARVGRLAWIKGP